MIKLLPVSDNLIDALGIRLIINRDIGNLTGFYYISHRERYIAINPDLHDREQLLVAAHELGDDRLHRLIASVAPLKDFMMYDITVFTEHDAKKICSKFSTEYQKQVFGVEVFILDMIWKKAEEKSSAFSCVW